MYKVVTGLSSFTKLTINRRLFWCCTTFICIMFLKNVPPTHIFGILWKSQNLNYFKKSFWMNVLIKTDKIRWRLCRILYSTRWAKKTSKKFCVGCSWSPNLKISNSHYLPPRGAREKRIISYFQTLKVLVLTVS